MNGTLDREIETFEKHRDELVSAHRGQFALVKDSEVVGTYASEHDAITDGYHRFGNVPFLVKEVLEEDRHLNFMSGLVQL
jgi:hypothetical protein